MWRKFCENLRSAFFQDLSKRDCRINGRGVPVVFLEGAWGIHLECSQYHKHFSILKVCIDFYIWDCLTFPRGIVICGFEQSLNCSLHPLFMMLVTQVVVVVVEDWFSKPSTITLVFSNGRYFRPKISWIAGGAFGPYVFIRDLAIGQLFELWPHASHHSFVFLRESFAWWF